MRTIDNRTPESCIGSGPFYDVTFTTNYVGVKVGDLAFMDHRQNTWLNQPGPHLATYKYQVTALVDADTVTLKWISATNGYTDDSPCDLGDGTMSGYDISDGQADVLFKRMGDSAFLMFVD